VTTKEMFAASLKDASPKDGRRRQKT
jgi:hypothetical protein